MTDFKKDKNIVDINLDHDYFKIEKVYPLRITKSFISTFTDQKGNFNWIKLKEFRHVNYDRGLPINHGFPIMEEEINDIVRKNNEGKNLTELQKYFQRPHNTIANILKDFSIKTKKENLDTSLVKQEKTILNSILNGKNPKTDENLEDNSVWKNSKIREDIQLWLGLENQNDNRNINSNDYLSNIRDIKSKKIHQGKTLDERREIHKRAYEKWDDIEETQLKKLWENGETIDRISTELMRHKGGIRSRLKKLGFETSKQKKVKSIEKKHTSSIKVESGYCISCGIQIDPRRLKEVPDTKLCIDCASDLPFKKHRIHEPLGTREDFKKDRSSWKKTNS